MKPDPIEYEDLPGKYELNLQELSDLFSGNRIIRDLSRTERGHLYSYEGDLEQVLGAIDFCLYESGIEDLQYKGEDLAMDLLGYSLKRLVEEHKCSVYTLRRRYKGYSFQNEHKCVMLHHPKFSSDLPIVNLINEPMWREEVMTRWCGTRADSVLEIVQLVLDRILRSEEHFDPNDIIERRWLDLDGG